MNTEKSIQKKGMLFSWALWLWIPSIYFSQGLPNTIVDQIAPVFLKDLSVENKLITILLGWSYLPWTLKAIWSPLVDGVGKKRNWIFGTQLFLSIALAMLAILIGHFSTASFFPILTVLALGIIATASATYDIAADGFYMISLDSKSQAFFSGIRNTFFRLSIVFGKGVVIVVAGLLISEMAFSTAVAWQYVFLGLAILMLVITFYHRFILPYPNTDKPSKEKTTSFYKNFKETWISFFRLKHIGLFIGFLLLYRLGEAQLGAISTLFFKDVKDAGGLAINNIDFGVMNGTYGTIALLTGGVLAGVFVSRHGLKKWFWPMVLALNIPNFIYIIFAHWQVYDFYWLSIGIIIEQFGYGFGFTGYMLYMLYICNQSKFAVAHYAIATGFMALSMMLPKFWSGALQTYLGYENFFWWVIICTIPSYIMVKLVLRTLPESFGRK